MSYCSYGSNKSAGSAVLFRKGLILEIEEQSSDFDGRIASVKAVCFGQRFNFVSVYAPNNPAAKRLFFSEELPKYMSVDHKNIVGGDFNCVESLDLDTLNHSNASCTLVGHQELSATVADFELEDRWRVENPKCRQYTWSNKTGTQASRLDKFFVPTDLTIDNCSISVFPFSDHKLVNIVLSMNQASACFRSKVTHWKLNTTILHEDDYKQKVRILIRDMATLMDAYADVTEWWDDLKAKIKILTISYCSKRKMKLKQKF